MEHLRNGIANSSIYSWIHPYINSLFKHIAKFYVYVWSVYLTFYSSIYLSSFLSIYLSIFLSIYLSPFCSSIYPSIYLFFNLIYRLVTVTGTKDSICAAFLAIGSKIQQVSNLIPSYYNIVMNYLWTQTSIKSHLLHNLSVVLYV